MNNNKIKFNNYKFKKYISNNQIHHRIKEISNDINNVYSNEIPLFIGVLNGSIYFMMDLLKEIDFQYEISFIKVSSYKEMSSEKCLFEYNEKINIKDRDVIIVEDIIDSGKTINFLIEKFKNKNPKSLKIITLLKKEKSQELVNNIKIDWYGFTVDDKYVIGYGLDINNLFRDLKDIYIRYE